MPDQCEDAPLVIERYETLLREHLLFYDALRLRERRPKSQAQRQFQDVAWGNAEPVTEHERAYVWHLKMRGIPPFSSPASASHIDDVIEQFEVGARPVSFGIGTKWDSAWREYRGDHEFW